MFKSAEDFGGFWVNAIKDFRGHEGEPLTQCNILFEGKKVGFFSEDSWGGCPRIDFWSQKNTTREERDAMYAKLVQACATHFGAHFIVYEGDEFVGSVSATSVESAREKAVAEYGKDAVVKDDDMKITDDTIGSMIVTICQEVDLIKEAKKCCRKGITFRTPDMARGAFRFFKGHPYSADMKAYVLKKYPNAIIVDEELKGVA